MSVFCFVLLQIEAEKEVFVQEHAVQTKMTEQMQKDILNQGSHSCIQALMNYKAREK